MALNWHIAVLSVITIVDHLSLSPFQQNSPITSSSILQVHITGWSHNSTWNESIIVLNALFKVSLSNIGFYLLPLAGTTAWSILSVSATSSVLNPLLLLYPLFLTKSPPPCPCLLWCENNCLLSWTVLMPVFLDAIMNSFRSCWS